MLSTMLNKLKRKFSFFLVCCLSFLLILKEEVSATFSRVNGLSIQSWMIKEDDTLIWLFPSEINNYKNVLLCELGTAAAGTQAAPTVNNNLKISSPWGGVSTSGGIIKKSVVSLFIARPYTLPLPTIPGEDVAGSDLTPIPKIPAKNANFSMLPPNNMFDLFYGFLVKDVEAGLYFNFSENSLYDKNSLVSNPPSSNDTLSESKFSSSEISLSLGVNIDNFIAGGAALALSAMVKLPAAKNTYLVYRGTTQNIKTSDWVFQITPGMNLDIKARATKTFFGDKLSLLGYCQFYTFDESNVYVRKDDENGDGDYEDNRDMNYQQKRTQNMTGFVAGVAVNYSLPKEFLVISGIGVSNVSSQYKGSREQMKISLSGKDEEYQQGVNVFSMPLNIAMEKNFYIKKFSLSLRLGLSHTLFSATETKIKDPEWQLAAGLPNQITTVREDNNFANSVGPSTLSLGVGVEIGKGFMLDFVVREHVVFTGTYILSGIPESLFSQGSLMYRF